MWCAVGFSSSQFLRISTIIFSVKSDQLFSLSKPNRSNRNCLLQFDWQHSANIFIHNFFLIAWNRITQIIKNKNNRDVQQSCVICALCATMKRCAMLPWLLTALHIDCVYHTARDVWQLKIKNQFYLFDREREREKEGSERTREWVWLVEVNAN